MQKGGLQKGIVSLLVMGALFVGSSDVWASHRSGDSDESSECQCRVRLSLEKTRYSWQSGTLLIVPVVDVSIRTKGETDAPGWSATLNYEGATSYESKDVDVPDGVSFGGSRLLQEGQCGRNKYNFEGIELSPISLTEITRELLGDREELDGLIKMLVKVEGCGEDEVEYRQSRFNIEEKKEFEIIKFRGWGRVR